MHNIEWFGGKRVENARFTVEFETEQGMKYWLKVMRTHYPTTEHFNPFINWENLRVAY